MPYKFNTAQMEIIDEVWDQRHIWSDNGKMVKNVIRCATIDCHKVGSREGVSAPEIGKSVYTFISPLEV